jgi:uncharacterized protein with von Willebrand factor type A (vWA) domain
VPVSITEYLSCWKRSRRACAGYQRRDFYYLSRATLVKDERFFDRFDRCSPNTSKGREDAVRGDARELPPNG